MSTFHEMNNQLDQIHNHLADHDRRLNLVRGQLAGIAEKVARANELQASLGNGTDWQTKTDKDACQKVLAKAAVMKADLEAQLVRIETSKKVWTDRLAEFDMKEYRRLRRLSEISDQVYKDSQPGESW